MREHATSGRTWNAISAAYQRRRQVSSQSVSLGALVDDDLGARLLGDVRGKWVLDAGCGGGQNSIALARMGAHVMGIDSSEAQIEYARHLAAGERLDIPMRRSPCARSRPRSICSFPARCKETSPAWRRPSSAASRAT